MVSGAFGGMLIEIEGRLVSKARVNGTSVVLELQSGSIVEVRTGREAVFSNSKPHGGRMFQTYTGRTELNAM